MQPAAQRMLRLADVLAFAKSLPGFRLPQVLAIAARGWSKNCGSLKLPKVGGLAGLLEPSSKRSDFPISAPLVQ